MNYKNWISVFLLTMMFFLSPAVFAQFESDTASDRNPEYVANAEELANDLKTRLTLDDEQTAEIKEILVDYQQDVSMLMKTGDADMGTPTAPETETQFETETQTETETETDTQIETETEIETETDFQTDTSVTQDESQNFPSDENKTDFPEDITGENSNTAQVKANEAIEGVLNETQRTTWTVIRDAWWRDANTRFGWDQDQEVK